MNNASGKIVRNGKSLYLLINQDLKDEVGLEEGDFVEYKVIAVAPGGQLSKTRMLAVAHSARAGAAKVSPPFTEHPRDWSAFLGLPIAFNSVTPY